MCDRCVSASWRSTRAPTTRSAQLGLRFPILSDAKREVVRAWDLDTAKEKGGIAFAAGFALDPDRRVLWRSVDRTGQRVSTEGIVGFRRSAAAHAGGVTT